MSSVTRILRRVALPALLLVSPEIVAAQARKLNAPLEAGGGDVGAFKVTPDGNTAVYWASTAANGPDLHAVNLTGEPQSLALGAPWLESGMPPYLDWLVSSSHAVGATTDTVFSALLDGSSGTATIGAHPGNTVWSVQLTPDSTRALYVTGAGTGPLNWGPKKKLFSAALDGSSAPIELGIQLDAPDFLDWYQASPDSARVVGISRIGGAPYFVDDKLFSVPVAGGVPATLLYRSSIGISSVHISADSSRVVYRLQAAGATQLFSVPLAGGAAPSALMPQVHSLGSFTLSPDSTRVAYTASASVSSGVEAYSVPLVGGATPVVLSGTVPGHVHSTGLVISPDSAWIVFSAQSIDLMDLELYRVPLAGGAPPTLLAVHTEGAAHARAITPDSTTLVYVLGQEGSMDVFSVSLAGGSPPVHLLGPLSASASPSIQIDASSRWVLCQHSGGLSAAPIQGGPPVASLGAPTAHEFRPGASSVVYLGDEDEPGVLELFLRPLPRLRPAHRILRDGGGISPR